MYLVGFKKKKPKISSIIKGDEWKKEKKLQDKQVPRFTVTPIVPVHRKHHIYTNIWVLLKKVFFPEIQVCYKIAATLPIAKSIFFSPTGSSSWQGR